MFRQLSGETRLFPVIGDPIKYVESPVRLTSTFAERGVVSVIRRNPDGSWHGDMLDGLAFVQAQRDHGAQLEGARALLIGAGGAGGAIAAALLEAGVRELVVHDVNQARVTALLELLADLGTGRLIAGSADPAAAQAAGCKTASGGHMVEAVQDLMADFMLGK